MKEWTGAARRPPCSQSTHDETVLAWDKNASRRARGWAGENVARTRGSTRLPREERSERAWKDQLVSKRLGRSTRILLTRIIQEGS